MKNNNIMQCKVVLIFRFYRFSCITGSQNGYCVVREKFRKPLVRTVRMAETGLFFSGRGRSLLWQGVLLSDNIPIFDTN